MQSCSIICISSATEIIRKFMELGVENPSLIRNGNRFSLREEISDRCTHLTACFSISVFFPNALYCHPVRNVALWFCCHLWLHPTKFKYVYKKTFCYWRYLYCMLRKYFWKLVLYSTNKCCILAQAVHWAKQPTLEAPVWKYSVGSYKDLVLTCKARNFVWVFLGEDIYIVHQHVIYILWHFWP